MGKYTEIMANDVVDGEGICVSFWTQGCPFHCKNCHNPQTWNFDGGRPYTSETKWEIIKLIGANGIERNFSVLGGEPLATQNLEMTEEVISSVRAAYPNIKIYLWTGFKFNELNKLNGKIQSILSKIDYLIDGRYEDELRDLTLKLRGSSNQNIWVKDNEKWRIDNG